MKEELRITDEYATAIRGQSEIILSMVELVPHWHFLNYLPLTHWVFHQTFWCSFWHRSPFHWLYQSNHAKEGPEIKINSSDFHKSTATVPFFSKDCYKGIYASVITEQDIEWQTCWLPLYYYWPFWSFCPHTLLPCHAVLYARETFHQKTMPFHRMTVYPDEVLPPALELLLCQQV